MSRPTQDTDNLHETYLYGIITLYDHTFQYIPVNCMRVWLSPITPILPQQYRFGLFPFRSPLLGKSIFSFFSCRYLDVSVPCVGPSFDVSCLQHDGLPHSDISGSNPVCRSPELFAAVRVLLRLAMPRHSPLALCSFT